MGRNKNAEQENGQEPAAEAVEKSIDQLASELEASQKQFADLSVKLEEKDNEIAELNETILKQQETISMLNDQVANMPKAPAGTLETFERDGVVYEIVSGTHIPGLGKRTALEIANDEAAQSKLIEMKSGLIRIKK